MYATCDFFSPSGVYIYGTLFPLLTKWLVGEVWQGPQTLADLPDTPNVMAARRVNRNLGAIYSFWQLRTCSIQPMRDYDAPRTRRPFTALLGGGTPWKRSSA